MKTIRIGNDIQINWTITRFGEPEDFTGKNVSVSLIDKFGEKQIFNYEINGNVISGTYFGKHQKSNGVYRLLLNENLGENDMVSLDYIDCFCLSNKLKNQTSNGSDSTSSINTEIEEFDSDINTTTDLTMYARKEYVDAVKLELESEMPTKVSDLVNDEGYTTNIGTITGISMNGVSKGTSGVVDLGTVITSHQDISGKANSADLAMVAFSGDYDDLTNKPSIPSKTSDLNNNSNFVSDASYVHTDNNFTTALKNKINGVEAGAEVNAIEVVQINGVAQTITDKVVNLPAYPTTLPASDVSAWAKAASKPSYAYSEITDTPTIPTIPTNVSEFTNDAGYLTSHQSLSDYYTKTDIDNKGYLTEHQQLKTINNESIVGTGNIVISGSGTQVQSDWNQSDSSAVDYIKNKPSMPENTSDLINDSNYVSDASYVHTDNNLTSTLKSKIEGVESGAEVNVIEEIQIDGVAQTITDKVVNLPAYPTTLPASDVSAWAKASTKPSYAYSEITDTPTIPSKVSDLVNDEGYTTNVGTITGVSMNGVSKGTSGVIDLGTVITSHQDISGKANKSDAIGSLSLSLDSTNYKITLSGTYVDGTAFTVSNVIDLPMESVVVNGSYDSTNKKVILTLQNGSTIDFSVADLVAGLQSEITSTNKLSADLVADGTNNKVYTASEKTKLSGIASGAEVNVQSDWNESDSSSDAFIKNKPTIPTNVSAFTNDAGYLTSAIFTFDSQTGTLIITTN